MEQLVANLHSFVVLALPAALIYAACCDLAAYRIPNWLSLVLAGLFFVAAFSAGLGFEDILWRFAAGTAVLVAGIALFAFGLLGGGDVKIMAASALWFGWALLPKFLILTALAGGLVALSVLIARKISFFSRFRSSRWVGHLLSPEEGVPYGVAIAVGGVVTFIETMHTERLFNGS